MKMELQQKPTFRQRVDEVVEAIIEQIMVMADYFYTKKHVAISEWILWMIAAIWVVWLMVFDVSSSSKTYAYIYNVRLWAVAFSLTFFLHTLGIVREVVFLRRVGMYFYATIWAAWAAMAMAANINSPAGAIFIVYFILAVVLAVRLKREESES